MTAAAIAIAAEAAPDTTAHRIAWREGLAETNGIKIAYQDAGPKTAQPFLLVMGLGCQLIHWPEAFCQGLLDQGYRVIRFDNRDIGLSSSGDRKVRINMQTTFLRNKLGLKTTANYSLYDMVADTVGLLDALKIPAAHLVGVSMGGMIAQLLAATHPDRVLSLTSIMSSPNSRRVPSPPLAVLKMMTRPLKDHGRAAVVARSEELFDRIGSPAYPADKRLRRAFMEQAFDRAYRPGGLMRQTHAIMVTPGFEDKLKKITAPTLVVHGDADELVSPIGGKRSAMNIPGAKLVMIPGMGHDFPVQLMPRWVELVTGNAARARA